MKTQNIIAIIAIAFLILGFVTFMEVANIPVWESNEEVLNVGERVTAWHPSGGRILVGENETVSFEYYGLHPFKWKDADVYYTLTGNPVLVEKR